MYRQPDFSFTPFPALGSSRVHLRRMLPGDAEALFLLRSDERVMRWIDRPRPVSIEDIYALMRNIEDGMRNGTAVLWVMAESPDGTMIGTIGYHSINPGERKAELGYLLSPDHWRKGLMARSVGMVLGYGFGSMRLEEIEAHVHSRNEASLKLLFKFGFSETDQVTDMEEGLVLRLARNDKWKIF